MLKRISTCQSKSLPDLTHSKGNSWEEHRLPSHGGKPPGQVRRLSGQGHGSLIKRRVPHLLQEKRATVHIDDMQIPEKRELQVKVSPINSYANLYKSMPIC